jgi:hypothetical protein
MTGALAGLFLGLTPVIAVVAVVYSGMRWLPYSDDPCLNDTHLANVRIFDAEQHQDAAAMAAAYDRGVQGLTECLRDPGRVGVHRRNYAASLVGARKAASEWHTFAATGGAWRDNPGRTPAIAEY